MPLLLAQRADRSLSIVDLERLDAHLAECWACRAPVARFKAAERAYRDPPEETLPPQIAASIVAALASAVPMDGAPAAAASVAASNGRAEQGERALDPDATQVFVIGEPTAVDRVPGIRAHEIDDEPEKPAGRKAAVLAAASALAGGTRAVAGATRALARELRARAGAGRPRPWAGGGRGAHRPRPRLTLPGALPALRPSVVAPVALIAGALIVGLIVSGVIGGGDPASSPQVAVPAGEPGVTSSPDVVVVPGAKEANAEAVEVAKARQRALDNGERLPDGTPDQPAAKPGAKPATSNSAQPPPAPPPPPPPPPPASQANAPVPTAKRATVRKPAPKPSSSGAATGIDAGNGATGAEQIPSAQDTSSVPDLAPPPQSVPRP